MALLLFLGLDFLLLIFENPVYRYITLLANKQNRAHMILRIRKPKHEIENLQENLVEPNLQSASTAWMSETSINNRYEKKVLNERRHVSFALMVQKEAQDKNQQRLKNLEHSLHRLALRTKKATLEGMNYRNQLSKLYEAQGLQTFLFNERQRRKSQDAMQLQKRRQICSQLRITNKKRIQLSRTVYDDLIKKRIASVKQRSQKGQMEKTRYNQSMVETNRQKYWKVKNEENDLKDRQRRIEEFKIKRARRNYLAKVEKELQKREEQERQLRELSEIQRSQIQALQQTQKLEKESKQIEKMFQNFFSTQS